MPGIGLDRLVNSAASTRRIDAALEPVLGAERLLLAWIPCLVHPAVTLATQRPVFVGVSAQHLVYGRLSMFRKRLTNIVVVPYGGGRITAYRKRRHTTTVDLEVPPGSA
jgi:hypothetical protein